MSVTQDESFGPVLTVETFTDEDEAVRLVNVSPFGLSASVWTEDRDRGEALGERLRVGGVSVNDVLSHYAIPGVPLGGNGESGFGSRRGVAGLEELTRTRSVVVHRTGLTRELWWFPYGRKGEKLVELLLEARQGKGVRRVWAGLRGFFRQRAP